MKHLSVQIIHLWTTKNFSFYARLTPHAVKISNHFVYLFQRYFRRLFKEATLLFPLFLLFLIFLNHQVSKSSFEVAKENVQLNPSSSIFHFDLAKKFISTNQYSLAENELYQAIIYSPSKQQSLEYFKELERIEKIKKEPTQIRTLSLYWQKITNQNSYYRDAYLKLAILNWKLYRPFDSIKFLTLAKEIDPNNKAFKKFEDSLK